DCPARNAVPFKPVIDSELFDPLLSSRMRGKNNLAFTEQVCKIPQDVQEDGAIVHVRRAVQGEQSVPRSGRSRTPAGSANKAEIVDFNETAPPDILTLSLHDALPI